MPSSAGNELSRKFLCTVFEEGPTIAYPLLSPPKLGCLPEQWIGTNFMDQFRLILLIPAFYKQALQSLNHMLVGAFNKEKEEETPLMLSSVHTVHCSLYRRQILPGAN